jgi:hypothetical protein
MTFEQVLEMVLRSGVTGSITRQPGSGERRADRPRLEILPLGGRCLIAT